MNVAFKIKKSFFVSLQIIEISAWLNLFETPGICNSGMKDCKFGVIAKLGVCKLSHRKVLVRVQFS